ncbi:MAG: hypothetical protein Q7S37_04925 [bacterium]|nr:hypothetical protein [bacterium]
MRRKRLRKIIRYRDKALKEIKKLQQKVDRNYSEIRTTLYSIRKLPPQYDTDK